MLALSEVEGCTRQVTILAPHVYKTCALPLSYGCFYLPNYIKSITSLPLQLYSSYLDTKKQGACYYVSKHGNIPFG